MHEAFVYCASQPMGRLRPGCSLPLNILPPDELYIIKFSMSQSNAQELQKYVASQITQFKHWIRPDPEDPLYLQILKGIYKTLAVLLLTVLSPVFALILTIAFLAAL